MKIADTLRSFDDICEGKADDLPEQAFLYVGTSTKCARKRSRCDFSLRLTYYVDMTALDINRRLYHRPFKAFRIHLSDGSSIPIINATPMLVSEVSAIVPLEMAKDPNGYPYVKRKGTIALADIVQFTDVN